MQHRFALIGTLSAVVALAIVGGIATERDGPAVRPAAERPRVGAPNVDGGTSRALFLRDPDGQVDRLAAGGSLVAWSVRTPADRVEDATEREPVVFPTSSRVIVADESGSDPLALDYPGRWISSLRMIRGVGGDPQLAILSCGSRNPASCRSELMSFTGRSPLKVKTRRSDAIADAAVDGTLSGDRQLVARPKPASRCLPRLELRTVDLGKGQRSSTATGAPSDRRTLPALPEEESADSTCDGLSNLFLTDNAAYATVDGSNPVLSLQASVVLGLDLTSEKPQWRGVQTPSNASDGGYGTSVGPAVRPSGLFWESLDTEAGRSGPYDLSEVRVPRDLRAMPVRGKTPNTSEPIAPGVENICAIAATSAALYELSNPRCAADASAGPGGAEIRRIVNPLFVPAVD